MWVGVWWVGVQRERCLLAGISERRVANVKKSLLIGSRKDVLGERRRQRGMSANKVIDVYVLVLVVGGVHDITSVISDCMLNKKVCSL